MRGVCQCRAEFVCAAKLPAHVGIFLRELGNLYAVSSHLALRRTVQGEGGCATSRNRHRCGPRCLRFWSWAWSVAAVVEEKEEAEGERDPGQVDTPGRVPPVNAAPVFAALALSTKQSTDVSGQVTATDPEGDALTFAIAANPASGTLVSFSPSGAFVYRPAASFIGDDTFRVQVTDTGRNTVAGAVAINVHPNRVPVATNDAMRADGVALANIRVLANDTDADWIH